MGHTSANFPFTLWIELRSSATITINSISQEKAADATLGKINANGLYVIVQPMLPYRGKFTCIG